VQVEVTPSVAWLSVLSVDSGNSLPSWMPFRLLWTPRSRGRPPCALPYRA